jgi:hypothetical protein
MRGLCRNEIPNVLVSISRVKIFPGSRLESFRAFNPCLGVEARLEETLISTMNIQFFFLIPILRIFPITYGDVVSIRYWLSTIAAEIPLLWLAEGFQMLCIICPNVV